MHISEVLHRLVHHAPGMSGDRAQAHEAIDEAFPVPEDAEPEQKQEQEQEQGGS